LGIDTTRLLRAAQLSLATLIALGVGWQAALVAGAYARADYLAAPARAETAARALPRNAPSDPAASRMGASGRDLVLANGVAVTVIDAGASRTLRVARGSTAAEVLDAAGLTVGSLDRLETTVDGTVDAGDVLRIVRITEAVGVVREPVAFAVKTVPDPTLVRGKTVVVTAGVPGVAENTYRIRAADGVVEERAAISSVEVQAPVTEVIRVGTMAPPVPGDIESIIRDAAARWGADPDQLLRIAYCESHYNPNAYNASSGASGLFQFLASTWALQSPKAGYGGASVFDPVANANTAAMMFAMGQARQWVCK
jgi:hypothetical protein